MTPTLSGAERGRVNPSREIPGGIWLLEEDGTLVNRPAAIRLLRQRETNRCQDLARQYLATRGDKNVSLTSYGMHANLLAMHLALCVPAEGRAYGPGEIDPVTGNGYVGSIKGTMPAAMFPRVLDALSDANGKLVDKASLLIEALPLQVLADGQLEHLVNQYDLLKETQTPATITHAQWEQIIKEGKSASLRTLISQHGSSALIQVLHGTDAGVWQE